MEKKEYQPSSTNMSSEESECECGENISKETEKSKNKSTSQMPDPLRNSENHSGALSPNGQNLQKSGTGSPQHSPAGQLRTTSFSVVDILDPKKFKGCQKNPRKVWSPWKEHSGREGENPDMYEDERLDSSGIKKFNL